MEKRFFQEDSRMIRTIDITVMTKGHCDVHDLTAFMGEAIQKSGLREGQVLVFVPGSTAGVTTVEFEPGVVRDLREFFDAIIPEHRNYHHHATWGDDNGPAHVRSTMLGPSVTVPVQDGKLVLGTWQQIVVLDFDTRPRSREVVIQVMGE